MKTSAIKKRKRLLFWHPVHPKLSGERPCPSCGKNERHYVAPMFGERGFFICENIRPGHI